MTSADDGPPSDGNEFPLRTLPSPPSDSSLSDVDSTDSIPGARPQDIGDHTHPHVPTFMEHEPTAQKGHARRRSSSLAGAAISAANKNDPQKHRRRRSDHIAEEEEGEELSSDTEPSDSESRSDSTDLELDDMSGDGLDDDEETGLNQRDRRRRRRKRRRNTLLDQRVVPTTDTYTKEEKKLADQTLLRSMLINGVLIGLWYDRRRDLGDGY
jgi:solute carrier family 35 protein C2